jgi:hypothetical protein
MPALFSELIHMQRLWMQATCQSWPASKITLLITGVLYATPYLIPNSCVHSVNRWYIAYVYDLDSGPFMFLWPCLNHICGLSLKMKRFTMLRRSQLCSSCTLLVHPRVDVWMNFKLVTSSSLQLWIHCLQVGEYPLGILMLCLLQNACFHIEVPNMVQFTIVCVRFLDEIQVISHLQEQSFSLTDLPPDFLASILDVTICPITVSNWIPDMFMAVAILSWCRICI